MAMQPQDHIEPDRLGRSTRAGMPPVGQVRTGTGVSRRPQAASRGARSLPQRVVAKVRVVRHRTPHKGRESLRRHIGYLQREAVIRDAGSGRFYDAKRDDIDAKQATREWREDRHHFRIILSPENAADLPSLKAYVRETMARIQRDLGALEYLAVNHTNTDNPHTHLLIRGRDHGGRDLVIPPKYIARGIRERAAQVATELLGERARDEAQMALVRETSAERFTSLDRAIERFAHPKPNGLRVDLSEVKLSRYALTSVDLLRQRLNGLVQMGLAEREPAPKYLPNRKSQAWVLSPDFQSKLRELGIRNDIIKQLHHTLGETVARDASEIPGTSAKRGEDSRGPSSARGILVSKAALDEQSDERLVVVQTPDGKHQYARVWADSALDVSEIGSVIEIGRSLRRHWAITREIIAVAESNDGSLYTTGLHRAWLKQHRPKLAPDKIERRLRRFSKTVVRLMRQPKSGVSRAGENAVVVDADTLERLVARQSKRPDVRVLAAHSLESQVSAEVYTWLDRQIIRTSLFETLSKDDIAHMPVVRHAMARRADWLLQHGFATRDPDAKHEYAVRFNFGAIESLRASEVKRFAQEWKQKHGKGFSLLRARSVVPGVYYGIARLHSGTYAMVATKERFFGAPVSRAPQLTPGEPVTAKVVDARHTKWERRGPGILDKALGMNR